MKKIYVASSWRNPYQEQIISMLKTAGHDPYDFKNPAIGKKGFAWSDIHPDWVASTNEEYRKALDYEIVVNGFCKNLNAMFGAEECLLVCPSGRSAHIEAGFLAGQGKTVVVLLIDKQEPELMYNCFNTILVGWDEFKAYYNVRE